MFDFKALFSPPFQIIFINFQSLFINFQSFPNHFKIISNHFYPFLSNSKFSFKLSKH
ncbi:hypothetical protein HPHPM3_1205 [Helicobacter pylori Hp M3]|nr:hypothetical protein HPHPM3_1205 [Helicobacter pylori Hp M3]